MNRVRMRGLLRAASISALAAAVGLGPVVVHAAPAVYFNDSLTAGEQTFRNTIAAADAAYNAANPGASQVSTIFKFDLTNLTGSQFSVTDPTTSTTVYVKTTLAGVAAANNENGDLGGDGFTNWDVNYTSGDWASALAHGYTISFYSDSGYTLPYMINAVGLHVSDWGTCCTTGNVTPSGATADASQIYMLFNGADPLLVGGINSRINGTEHFIGAIDDRNSFNSVTMVPNGKGEYFGAGGELIFSLVALNSVPAGSSVVTVGSPPNIDQTYTPDDVTSGRVNPVFDGGTLNVSQSGSISVDMSITGAGGGVNTNGNEVTLSGVLSDDTNGVAGALTKAGAGELILTNANTYTGATTVSGGTLTLSGDGDISHSARLVNNGVFDISDVDASGTSLRSLAGTGDVELGAKNLSITNAGDTFSGSINGTGGLSVSGGTLVLTGTNGFTGGLVIDHGQVRVGSDAALGAGALAITNGILQASADFNSGKAISLNGAAIVDTAGHAMTLSGDIAGATLNKYGSGVLTLSGHNSQSGLDIAQGSVLATSAQAVGAAGGDITLRQNTSFVVGAGMTLTQAVHFAGTNATFDTGANTVTLTGPVDGSSCLNKSGSGRLSLAGPASNAIGACVQQGTLSFNNVFTGHVWVEQGGTAGGSGLIQGDMDVRGTLAPGNSPGVLVVNGRVTQVAGSTLALDIDGPTAGVGAGHFDTLILTGANGVYTAAGTVAPHLRGITGDATNTYKPNIGDTFQVVVAQGGVTGAYASVTQPTAGLPDNSRFDVLYGSNTVTLAVTAASYAKLMAGATQNAVNVGAAVDQTRPAAGARDNSAAGLFAQGLMGQNAAALTRTLEQAAGEIHADSLDGVLKTGRLARGAVSEHLSQNLEQGLLPGERSVKRRLWGDFVSDYGHVDGDAQGVRYEADSTAMVLGGDVAVGSDVVVGLAFAYGKTRTSNQLQATANAESYQGMAYAGWSRSGSYLNGVVAGGVDDYTVRRQVELSNGARVALSDPSGYSWSADLEAGHRFMVRRLSVTPMVGVAYDRIKRDGFVEAGDALTALTFADGRREGLSGRAGVKLDTALWMGGVKLTPYGQVAVTHEFQDAAADLTARLNGARFQVGAAAADRTAVRGGVGLGVDLTPSAALRFGYRFSTADSAQSNGVNASFSLSW